MPTEIATSNLFCEATLKPLQILLLLSISSFAFGAGPQIPILENFKSLRSLPKLPFLVQGASCECCGNLISKKALKPFSLREAAVKNSKKIGDVKAGEVLESVEFFEKTVSFGKATVEGKKVDILVAGTEGSAFVLNGGKVEQLEPDSIDKYVKQEDWLRIKTKSGMIGWVADIGRRDDGFFEYGGCE